MPRGKGKRGVHKGKGRHFTNEEELAAVNEKQRKEKEWKKRQGIESDESDEEGGDGQPKPQASKPDEDGVTIDQSGSESETDSDEEEAKAKGVSHLIDIANPNHAAAKQVKKVSELDAGAKAQLSRREREEVEKQQAKAHYQKLHLAGKTDEARADLARLAIIRKQREDQQKKKDEEKQQKDAAAKAAEARSKEKRAAAKH